VKSYCAKPNEVQQDWLLVDAEGQTLGRLAVEIAHRLRGKHKPVFTPHVDTGDFIVVINAEKVKLTGKKIEDKKYYRHTGYPGGIRETNAAKMLATKPTDILTIAVKGMLPKNSLGRKMLSKLKVYAGSAHPHQAQQPQPLELKGI
jgi:large subunit ribosomal protein L13